MRKLIESSLVSLDGVIEAPERWANFDAEAMALSIESWPAQGDGCSRT